MTAHWIVSIALIVFITGCVVWLVDRQAQRNAQQRVRSVEAETWGDDDVDEAFEEARRVLDAQRQYTCAFCGRNAGHNAGCPSVRRHRAVRDGGES